MCHKRLCVFDLDGTLYPKESPTTFFVRRKVISAIASIQGVSIEAAQKLYNALPNMYPNPYYGLESLGLSSDLYRNIFDSVPVRDYISRDDKLCFLFATLASVSEIIILSFAPPKYVQRMLNALGVDQYVTTVISIDQTEQFQKDVVFRRLRYAGNYETIISVGDDIQNDLMTARKYGIDSILVDFQQGPDIYSAICEVIRRFQRPSIPRVMRVENISFCNEACTICPYQKMKRKRGIMSDNLFKKLLLEHSSLTRNPKLIFPASVGEPFLDPLFFERVQYASSMYTEIASFTNATMLTKDAFYQFVSSGGTELMLTLHGFNRKNHERITQTSYYDIVRQNIESAVDANMKLDYPITIFLDIYADSSKDCLLFVDDLTNKGIYVQRIDLDKTHNWGGKVNTFSQRTQKKHCTRIYNQFAVQFDGNVVPCCIDVEGNYSLGNAQITTLTDIFSSDKYIELMSYEQSRAIHKLPLCNQCNV